MAKAKAPVRPARTKGGPSLKNRAPVAAATRPGRSLKVRALAVGFYDHKRRREGDVFRLVKEQDYTPKWMAWVDPRTPEKETGPKEALKQKHDEILTERAAGRSAAPASEADPLGAND